MIDPAIAPKVSTPDTTAYSSAAAAKADNSAGNGFYDALSTAGHHDRHRQDADTEAQPPATGETATDDQAGEVSSDNTRKPLIEIARTAISRALNNADGKEQSEVGKTGQETADGVTEADTRKSAKIAIGNDTATHGSTQATVLDGAQRAAVAKHAQSVKSEKSDKTVDDAETAEGADQDDTGDASAELNEVLSLLSGGAADAGQANVQVHQAGRNSAQHAANGPDNEAALAAAIGKAETQSDTSDAGELAANADTEQGTDATETDRSFRFLRADGKGQALSMRTSAAEGEPVKVEAGSAKDGGAPIAVLEARRYIAPASSNAVGITAALMGDGEWASAMAPGSELANAATQSSSGKVVNTLKLQMSPIELGNVTATLRLTGEELSVQLTVETHAAYKQLSDDQSDMLKALRAQGFAVDQIQVSLAVSSADRTDSAQTGGQGQQTGQQASQSGNQGGNGSGERRMAAERQETANQTGTMADGASTVQTVSGGSGSSRPGHVYL